MELLTKFKSAVVEFDSTQSNIGAYAGLAASRVSRGMTEEIPFTVAEADDITETIDAMRSVQSEIGLPINWSMIGKVKPHIDQRRKALREQADPILHRCVLIRISATAFFGE